MADEKDQSDGVAMPPTQGANHFAMAASASEMLLSVGHSRVAIAIQNGQINPIPRVEWFVTLAMSPTAIKQLHAQIGQSVDAYEKAFGKIPTDPSVKITTGAPPKS